MSAVIFIVTTLVVISATLAIIFFLAWKTLNRSPHALTWSFCFAVATLQWTFNILRDVFPTPEIGWMVLTALGLGAVGLALVGHLQRVGSEFDLRRVWFVLGATLLAVGWFTFIDPHLGLRTGLHPLVTGLMFVVAARVIITTRSKALPAEIGAALFTLVFGLDQILAGGIAIGLDLSPGSEALTLYQQVNFLVMPACYVGMSMFMVFVMASDLAEEMRQLAVRDQLTGVLNRRGLFEAAERQFAYSRRRNQPLALIMADIDHFKSVNDNHGHAVGDLALQSFAKILMADRRAEDLVGRFGGEEFILVLPGVAQADALRLARELQERLQDTKLAEGIFLTASYGVAVCEENDDSIRELLVRADHALYLAKDGGRNRAEYVAASQLSLAAG